MGQAMMAVKGLDGRVEYDKDVDNWECDLNDFIGQEFTDAGINTFNLNFNCWTSTENDQSNAVGFEFESRRGYVYLNVDPKDKQLNVRPFIAF
jgi:hypothetical protein